MKDSISNFVAVLAKERILSERTAKLYRRDMEMFHAFIRDEQEPQPRSWSEVRPGVISRFLDLMPGEFSTAALERKSDGIKSFFEYLLEKGEIQINPLAGVWIPSDERLPLENCLPVYDVLCFGPKAVWATLAMRLGISSMGLARHSVRVDGETSKEFLVTSSWGIEVNPAFGRGGVFAVFYSPEYVRCAFGLKYKVVVDRLFAADEWDDNVIDALAGLRLVRREPPDRVAVLDGVSYRMHVTSQEMKANLAFSNPLKEWPRNLERACFKAAVRAANGIDHPDVLKFISSWEQYMKGR